MNLGLVLQALAPLNEAQMQEAIQSYQRALRVFTGKAYPQEYAILQNNLAIAYLSISSASGTKEMYQTLAIQTFEEALKWVTIIDSPNEYAILQNNLANTLQSLPSNHPVENHLRALAAYDEALKVRTARDTPIEYANTIANKAKILYNLPNDIGHSEAGKRDRLIQAKAYYQEAQAILIAYGERERAEIIAKALNAIEAEL
jgi:tetratricopeptide (TPR) repeat protein